MFDIGIIGAGSWGTAMAQLLSRSKHNIMLWARNKELVEEMKTTRENKTYLKGIKLSNKILITNDLEETVDNNNILVIAIPTPFLRDSITGFKIRNKYVVSLSKGVETNTFFTPSEIIKSATGINNDRLAVLSGPNFAKEVALQLPTTTVIATRNSRTALILRSVFNLPSFKVYVSDDIKGVEICGAMKNIIAIAAGISEGLELGYNTKASLLTRGLDEMYRFGKRFGAKYETFMGFAGVGDLILTTTGNLSRNRAVGLKLSKGESIDEITRGMKMIPEGINTTKAIYEYTRKQFIDLPITEQVYKVIYEHKTPSDAMKDIVTKL